MHELHRMASNNEQKALKRILLADNFIQSEIIQKIKDDEKQFCEKNEF